MALSDNDGKALGFGGDGTPDIVAVTEIAIQEQQMTGEPFSPGEPIRPYRGYSTVPRSRDFATGVNIASRPRLNEQVAFSTLKALVANYDVAQMCIWHRIDSIRSMKWHLVPVEGFNEEPAAYIEIGMQALRKPDRESSFKTWLAKYLFDILAYDAGALYKLRNNAGQAIGLRVLDGTTIAPLLDYYGNRPTGDAPAYVQFAQGVPWEWLRDDDLIYEPFRPQTDSLYGKAPLETLLLNANTDLRFQQYFLNHFTEGNIPEGFASAPEGWSPQQIEDFQEQWDSLMYGDDTQKSQIKWVPFGTRFDWANEGKFDDTFSLFLMRKTAAMYHVVPSDLGFTEDVNRATGETQVDVQFRIGDLPLIEHVGGILTSFLQNDLHLPLEFQWDTGREVEDRLAVAQADDVYIKAGVISPSEVRERVFGKDEPDGKTVPRFVFSARSGPIPLSALFAVSGPIDPESGAPLPGAALPHKPFSPIEGVTPGKPADTPPLAVQIYPADNVTSIQAEAADDNLAVVKSGEGAGLAVESGTVAEGSPLLDDEEQVFKGDQQRHISGRFVPGGQQHFDSTTLEPESATLGDETPEDEVAKAAEDRAFRAFVKARVKSGSWRDFSFSYGSSRSATERNRAGRVEVAKSRSAVGKASAPLVAGLVLRAADTGRVFMLQRALDDASSDGSTYAAGKWEFPGGHIEPGESDFEGAVREWSEEVGTMPPLSGQLVSEWISSDGVYHGFVVEVLSEDVVDINPVVRQFSDPDGDDTEVCAWWDPRLIPDNRAVRNEILNDADAIMPALVAPVGSRVSKATESEWAKHPMHKVEQPLAGYHAPKIAEGLRQLVSDAEIKKAVESYLKTRGQ